MWMNVEHKHGWAMMISMTSLARGSAIGGVGKIISIHVRSNSNWPLMFSLKQLFQHQHLESSKTYFNANINKLNTSPPILNVRNLMDEEDSTTNPICEQQYKEAVGQQFNDNIHIFDRFNPRHQFFQHQ